jgi:RNA polymerase sigma-70 factor (ECF subfamily)
MSDSLQSQLAVLRPQLLRFARLQLRSDAAAEDAVQEALLAALANASGFAGEASLKTWVFSILRNKIVDEVRRRIRSPEVQMSEDGEDRDFEELFDASGHWSELPSSWGDPAATLEQKRFWAVFEACLNNVPEKPARVFMMREFLGLETEEICKELTIGASNCWVLLHRARTHLRLCLTERWFGQEVPEGV